MISKKCTHRAQTYTHVLTYTHIRDHIQLKTLWQQIPKTSGGTWSARSFPDLAQFLHLCSTEQWIKDSSREKRAMWYININHVSLRHKCKGQISTASFDHLFLCLSLSSSVRECTLTNKLLLICIQVCWITFKRLWQRCIHSLSGINHTLNT